ncbi:MAG: zinc-dependent peptidase [Pirellulaceae bacterium]|nr:zinc-dependent peptidase [Pirellulaceae bacterium]
MIFGSLFRNRRRRQLLAQPFPKEWRGWLASNVRIYGQLPTEQRANLERNLRIIVAEREFVGCQGLMVTDEMKVTVAGQASLLLLGEEGYYFERVPSILLYPGTYVRPQRIGDQNWVDDEVAILGESWQRGSIVLSWPAVLAGGRIPDDGQNLVLHEFAHHLDGLDGEMGGTPPLPSREAERRWKAVLRREYRALCDCLAAGDDTLIDPYGATSEAEFFAVTTECFFERPVLLRDRHRELFDCFREFYKVDPAAWFEPEAVAPANKPREAASMETFHEEHEPADQPPLATADQYFTRASDHFDDDRFDLAEADFDQAVRLDPTDQEALLRRADCRLRLGYIEAALADAERALRLEPDDHEALHLRGICRVEMGQFREGLADLDQIIAIGEASADTYFYRGLAHSLLENLPAALADLTRAIELDPRDAEAYAERAEVWEALGNSAAAKADRQRGESIEGAGN